MTQDQSIDEIVNWILPELEGPKIEYKYASGEGWEFLIFTSNNIGLDSRGLHKIEVTSGMIMVQIKVRDGKADIWFGRKMK